MKKWIKNIRDKCGAKLALSAHVAICLVLSFAGGDWDAAIFFVFLILGSVPSLFFLSQWADWKGHTAKQLFLALCAFLIIAAIGWRLHNSADTPEYREKRWMENPTSALRQGWVRHETNNEKKVGISTFLKIENDEMIQIVTRSEATLSGVQNSTDEWRSFKYSVLTTGANKDGFPFVEIAVEGPEVNGKWLAVFKPRDATMELYKAGFNVGRFTRITL